MSRIQLDQILPEVYSDLRALASRALKNERADHTYQTTELVHEIYLRLAAIQEINWRDPDHLMKAAVGVVRRVLIDYARARKALKRLPTSAVSIADQLCFHDERGTQPEFDLLELEESLERLQALDPRKAEIVQLRYFGGQEIETVARLIGISPATVKREWALAKAWLFRDLS